MKIVKLLIVCLLFVGCVKIDDKRVVYTDNKNGHYLYILGEDKERNVVCYRHNSCPNMQCIYIPPKNDIKK